MYDIVKVILYQGSSLSAFLLYEDVLNIARKKMQADLCHF